MPSPAIAFARSRATILALGALLTLAACAGDKPTGPAVEPGECGGPGDLKDCLPSWTEFAPPLADVAPAPAGAPTAREERGVLKRIDDTGATIETPDVTFSCTEQTYNFVDNPDKAMSFNIDETVIWPGSLVQGKSHRDGQSIGALLQLPIVERAPLSLTLSFNNANNTQVVAAPAFGTVSSALGAMIGGAQAEGLATASNIVYESSTYSSERQAALAFKVSGRYMAFEASASGGISRTTTTNTVAAQFMQQMYVAGVTQPPTPEAFFSDAFTPTKYREQETLGRIGAINPPLYVSRIGYGRMMVFTMTANADANEIAAALSAAYGVTGVGEVEASLSAKHRQILSSAEIRITQVGGDQANALNAIKSGRLADYFTDVAPLTSAAPIWFELKSLTGEVAMVSEAGTYTESTCVPQLPGTFDFEPEITIAVPFTAGTQRDVQRADVNGDGRLDLVYNELRSAAPLNRVHVALGTAGGGFTLAAAATSPHAPTEGWANYDLLVLDVDGDGRDDLAWNHRGTNNVVYVAMSDGAGGFTFGARKVHVNNGWGNYHVTAGDLDGDGRGDLLWSSRTATLVRVYPGFALGDSSFTMTSNYTDRAGNWAPYAAPIISRVDGDAYGDLVFSNISSASNHTYVARFTPGGPLGTFAWAVHSRAEGGWAGYQLLVGDIDGANSRDLVWVRSSASSVAIHRSMNSGSGTFASLLPHQAVAVEHAVRAHLGDVNNDGRADVVLVTGDAPGSRVRVGFGTGSGILSFATGPQDSPHVPGTGWASYDRIFVGDVNGDGKDDVVWTNASSDARIYVAVAK